MQTTTALDTRADSMARSDLRRDVFTYADGVVSAAVLRALDSIGALESSLADQSRPLSELVPNLPAGGFGYLRAGLRCLAGQGWIEHPPTMEQETTFLAWTESGRKAMRHRAGYLAAANFLARFSGTEPGLWEQPWDQATRDDFARLVADFEDRTLDTADPVLARVATHLDAPIALATILTLLCKDLVGDTEPDLSDPDLGPSFERILRRLGWIEDNGAWSAAGIHLQQLLGTFYILGSYLPMFAEFPRLYRGELSVASSIVSDRREWHVQRELNVIGSGYAHRRYFADADSILREIFNREPVEAQPAFVADMGCGDGSWLVHIDRLVRQETLRGQHLEKYPLTMVGVDFNPEAFGPAQEVLDAAGIEGLLIQGDIGDPDALQGSLAEHGLEMSNGLHIRAFIDHDRNFREAHTDTVAPGRSTGTYVAPDGHALSAAAVEADLIDHLARWRPHVGKHGMVILEAHCVAPEVARQHLGFVHSVAFDTYHAHSHQLPIDHSAFMNCCRAAGLEPVSYCERHYPSNRPFVAVSLNRLIVSEGSDTLPAMQPGGTQRGDWAPAPDDSREDGEGLHRLLYADGDLRYPRPWATAPTGYVVAGALSAIESRLAGARSGDVIRVLDYGAGTGLAAVELLKACQQRGLAERLERANVQLEVHLADLPGSWFAKGFDLLSDCAWVHFQSLRDESGGFRPIGEIFGDRRMDAVMANMVFHLIPPRALDQLGAELAEVLAPDGSLIWSAPDLGPSGPGSVLFHDPNRALRAAWLDHPAVIARRQAMSDEERAEADLRAGRRILAVPNPADAVEQVLGRHLVGGTTRRTYEMLREEVLDAILVPSNQGEFLSEIVDRDVREDMIRELMLGQVLPELEAGPAGTSGGINIQWTFGTFRR